MDRPISQQALKAQKQQRWIRIIIAILMIFGLIYLIQSIFSPSVSRSSIRTDVVSKGTITATINAGGVVVPLEEETITSAIDSQILTVIAQLGANLKKGDLILELNTQGVELEMDSLKEKLALKDTQIKAKNLQLNKYINDIDSRYELLEVDLQSRVTKANSVKQLSGIGGFSKHELLESELNVKRTNIEMRQLRQSKIDHKSTTQAEIEGLTLEKSILNKELIEQQRLFNASSVKATRDGVLTWLKNDEGASVSLREPLAKISDTSRFRIEATLSDFYATQLFAGMAAEIVYKNQTISGRLGSLTPTIENGVMKILIVLDKPNNQLLRNNLRVDVGLVTESVNDALSLGKGTYVSGRGVHPVFVIRDNIAIKTEVEIGLSNANYYHIVSGLKEGDEVIVSDVSNFLHLNKFDIN